jgi:hypothetical protein
MFPKGGGAKKGGASAHARYKSTKAAVGCKAGGYDAIVIGIKNAQTKHYGENGAVQRLLKGKKTSRQLNRHEKKPPRQARARAPSFWVRYVTFARRGRFCDDIT